MKTPDITPAQLLAALAAIGTELVNAKLVGGQLEQLIVGIAGIVLPLTWTIADALIRHGRSRLAAAQAAAALLIEQQAVQQADRPV